METTFCSCNCSLCDNPKEKTIILKSGKELRLCTLHLKEIEDEFAGKIIERHIPYYPWTSPNTTPNIPITPYPQPYWNNPVRCGDLIHVSSGTPCYFQGPMRRSDNFC